VAEDSLLADAFPQGSKSRLHATSQHATTGGKGGPVLSARPKRPHSNPHKNPSLPSKP
jgi:hypothetical protein